MKYGILAYGSLIDNPGKELEKIIDSKIDDVETPFNVEFARSSSGRCGAPTVVPYENGKKVIGKILVIKDGVSEKDLKDILYRRETNNIGTGKEFDEKNILSLENAYDNNSISKCFIIKLKNEDFNSEKVNGIEKVFATSFSANIENLSAEKLADLAIKSFENKDCKDKKNDGINYLYNAKKSGIETKLSKEYEEKILKKIGKDSLEEIIKS